MTESVIESKVSAALSSIYHVNLCIYKLLVMCAIRSNPYPAYGLAVRQKAFPQKMWITLEMTVLGVSFDIVS